MTIQTNDEIQHDLDHVTSPQKNNNNKKLAFNANVQSSSSTNGSNKINSDNSNIANTLQHIVQQLDILNRVSFFYEFCFVFFVNFFV